MVTRLTRLLITIIFLTTVCHSIFASDYLHELANEAESTANVSTTKSPDGAEKKAFEKMEALLEAERPSTYKFYTKLYPKNKERVFKFFANDQSDQNNRLSHLQKKVMDIYFNQ